MDAVIMAAGKGTRIKDFNPDIPKALLEIRGKPLICYNLDNLVGVANRAIIVTGHLGSKIKEKLGDSYRGLPIYYVEQTEINGTGGAVFSVIDVVSDDFLVITGDCYYAADDIKRCAGFDYSLLVREPNPMLEGGVVLDEKDKVIKILEKEGRTNLCNAGLYKLNKKIFSYPLERSIRGEFEITFLLNKLAMDVKITAVKTKIWAHISYTSDILTLTNFLDGYGTKKKSFANVIFKKNKEILLQLRSNEVWLPFPNHWQLPGGLIEENETPLKCAMREMKEEMNLDLDEEDLTFVTKISSEAREDYVFECRKKIDHKIIILQEGEEINYFPITPPPRI